MTDAADLVGDLDPDQRAAVVTDSRLVAVIAGAGSGKTRVLTRRVAYRVAIGDADAAHTVVLTFTREAAGELRRRLPSLGLRERVTAGTFHAVAHDLLRQRWRDRDQRPRAILDDRRRILGEVAGSEGLDELVAEIGWASARGLDAAGYATARGGHRSSVPVERVVESLRAYDREKRRRGVIDLDDLLTLTNAELERDHDYADAVRWRFRHVLVDEAQDLNPLQHRFLEHLGRDDLFLVGDPSQAIYGFTGSDPTLLLDAADRFPGVEIIRLPANHRCTPQIVEVGRFALAVTGAGDDLRAARPDGPAVEIADHEDEEAEAEAVTAQIATGDPMLLDRTAVLARTHAALAPIRRALASAGVPVRRTSAATNPLLLDAFRQGSNTALRAWANDTNEQLLDREDPAEVEHAVVRAVFEFLREQPTGDSSALRSWVSSTDPLGTATPGVELLTFHAAKGREWHTVHVIGAETSLVPHRSATTIAAKHEEARLLYVALTRATDVLRVHWARRRSGYRRRLTPLLDGFEGAVDEIAPPPAGLTSGPVTTPQQDALGRLMAWRATTARAGGILPDAVCSDRALAAIARGRPATPSELDALTGLGPLTSQRLFDGIRDALAEVS